MADVKRCDRCGKIYEAVEANPIEILAAEVAAVLAPKNVLLDRAMKSLAIGVDLCTACEADFIKWWKGRGEYGTAQETE